MGLKQFTGAKKKLWQEITETFYFDKVEEWGLSIIFWLGKIGQLERLLWVVV